jgi:hypothetical protein
MAAAQTYEPIATTTLGSNTASVTFSSLGSYTDIKVILESKVTVNDDIYMQFNSDTGSNYGSVWIRGNGTTASSVKSLTLTGLRCTDLSSPTTTNACALLIDIMNYGNSTSNKAIITRGNNASTGVDSFSGTWRSTAAITSIKLYPASGNFATGGIFTIYGIKAA